MRNLRSLPLGVFTLAAAAAPFLCRSGVAFRDAGEIGAAAESLGIAHPTGFPLDMLLLRGASHLPFGSIAFRQNLMTTWIAAFAAACLCALVMQVVDRASLSKTAGAIGGAFAAALLWTWTTFLMSAVDVEVYATALALVLVAAREVTSHRRGVVLGVLFGLSLGAHVTAPLFIAALVVTSEILLPRQRSVAGLLLRGAVGAVLTAPVLAYLPLASRRQPAMDWGDPETFARFLEHITAARIRTAYADVMSGTADQTAELFSQLGELGAGLFVALVAVIALRARREVWVLVALMVLDVLYAARINPMGIVDHQVGHTAGAVLCGLAGCGVAVAVNAGRDRPRVLFAATLALLLVGLSAYHVDPRLFVDDEVPAELYGLALDRVPARSVVVCQSDDVCASLLFARHAEGRRPDVDVVVAQHLWEPRERARLEAEPDTERPVAAEERGARAIVEARRILAAEHGRPVVSEALKDVGLPLYASSWVPFLAPRPTATHKTAERRLEEHLVSTTGTGQLRATRARHAWSSAFGTLGKSALAARDERGAASAFRRAVELAPERAVAWTNLGVALAYGDDYLGAIAATEQSLLRDPERGLAWSNLVRFTAVAGNPERARALLDAAAAQGVTDTRLDQLREQLREQLR